MIHIRTHYNLPRKTNNSAIARLRLERNLTQAQLAEIIGVSQQQLGGWENGVRKPKLNALIKIAKALNVDFNELITWDEVKNE